MDSLASPCGSQLTVCKICFLSWTIPFSTVVLNLFTEGLQIQTYNFVRESHYRNLTQVNWLFCFITERGLLHKISEVLLKDCWGPHKGCLGAACSSQKSGWQPLIYN